MVWETVLIAVRAIQRNVMRSSLTILGIVIGVAAVITMVTLGKGATEKVTTDIEKMGSNLIQIRPGQAMRGPMRGVSMSIDLFKIADAEAIEKEVSGLAAVAPSSPKSMQVIYGNQNRATSIYGTTSSFLITRDWPLDTGSAFSFSDERAGKAVCIIGKTVRDALFGQHDPLGETIRLGRISFKVIGVLTSKGQSNFGTDQDDIVLIPIRAFQRRISGNTDVSMIYVSTEKGVSTDKARQDIERLLRERRRILLGKEDDFNVMDMQEIVSTVTGTTRVLTALLGAVAAVSLLVGGIGIMNIMLVSVTERTREIGTRLAVGALERDVLMQFLVEAVVLSSLGGIIGIILGLAAAFLGSNALGVPFIFSGGIIMLSFIFSAAVGVMFGYLPAKKASSLNPIDALRYE
jgi:putative ABC transport system permease protein